MFKKTVLTPEEIMGKKVHFNRKGGGDGSEKPSRSHSIAGSTGGASVRSAIMDKVAAITGGGNKGPRGALLPSSTNRTAQSQGAKSQKEKKKALDDRRLKAEVGDCFGWVC